MWSWRSPFMSACYPLIQAERRCKARCLNQSRWDCSLAAGRWCPLARCRYFPQLATALSNRSLPSAHLEFRFPNFAWRDERLILRDDIGPQ
jgi:hypothetical protein